MFSVSFMANIEIFLHSILISTLSTTIYPLTSTHSGFCFKKSITNRGDVVNLRKSLLDLCIYFLPFFNGTRTCDTVH